MRTSDKKASRRKQISKTLRDRDGIFRSFIKTNTACVMIARPDGGIVEASDQYLQLTGYSRDEIAQGIGGWRCLSGVTERGEEIPFKRSDRTAEWFAWEVHPWYEHPGKIGGIILFTEVITAFKRSEIKRKKSEERFRMIFENSFDAFSLAEPDDKIIMANPAGCRMFERSEKELIELGRNGIIDTTDPGLADALNVLSETVKFVGELTGIKRTAKDFPLKSVQ